MGSCRDGFVVNMVKMRGVWRLGSIGRLEITSQVDVLPAER